MFTMIERNATYTDRQTDRHFYLTSEKIRNQGEENDRKVFESSSPAKYIGGISLKSFLISNSYQV